MEGLSHVGKSSVYEELIRRGYKAVSTDRAWSYYADPDTGLPGGPHRHDTWLWDRQRALADLENPEPEVLFVCGSSRNSYAFFPYSPRSSTSASTTTRCVAASKRVRRTTGRMVKRESNSCSN